MESNDQGSGSRDGRRKTKCRRVGAGGWGVVVTLVLAVGSGTGLAKHASAKIAREEPVLEVHVYDYAGVQGGELARAQDEAARVLERSGIRTVWLNYSAPGAEPQTSQACRSTGGALVLHILSRAMAERRANAKDSVGFAVVAEDGTGIMASVFYHRVESLAVDTGSAPAVILGYALAHEIGHLLLGTNSHSLAGIMRACWTENELLSASAGRLGFYPKQAAKMRAEVRGRAKAVTAQHVAGRIE